MGLVGVEVRGALVHGASVGVVLGVKLSRGDRRNGSSAGEISAREDGILHWLNGVVAVVVAGGIVSWI